MILVLQEGFHQEWLDVWISHLQHLKIARWWAVVLSISRVIRARERDVVELRSVHAKKRVWCRKEKEWHEQGGHGWSRGSFFQNLWCTWAELLHHPAWKLRSIFSCRIYCIIHVLGEFLWNFCQNNRPHVASKSRDFLCLEFGLQQKFGQNQGNGHDFWMIMMSHIYLNHVVFGFVGWFLGEKFCQNFPAELDGLVDFVSSWESTCSHLRCDIIHPLDYLPSKKSPTVGPLLNGPLNPKDPSSIATYLNGVRWDSVLFFPFLMDTYISWWKMATWTRGKWFRCFFLPISHGAFVFLFGNLRDVWCQCETWKQRFGTPIHLIDVFLIQTYRVYKLMLWEVAVPCKIKGQGRVGAPKVRVPMVSIVFSRDSWGL